MLIGEVSQHSGISARMLRHYDSIGLVSPTGRTASGYREYSDPDLQRLFHVESLRSLGLSLIEVRKALDDADFGPSSLVEKLISRTRERIARDEELVRRLEGVQASARAEWAGILRTVALMRGLDSDDPSRRQSSALSAAEDEAAGLLAEAVLAEDNLNVAGTLRWALERSGDEALPVMVAALDSADALVRRRAVIMIAELSTARADVALVAALSHADVDVRERAAVALGVRGDLRSLPVLMNMVVSGHNDVEAAETLGSLARRHDAGETIVGMIAAELVKPEQAVRHRLTQALAELPAAAARGTLQALVNDPDPGVARTAAYILDQFETDV